MTGASPEALLRARVVSGDRSAFSEVVRAHQDRVYAFTLRLTGDENDALDLLQDVFVAAWGGIHGFRGDSTLSTWLHGIAVRLGKAHWRRSERRDERERAYARDRFEQAVCRAMPEARIDLEHALQELPPRMRMALVLHCIEGRPQKEVASIMGVAEGTVKAHVHKARSALKEMLDP